MASHLAKSVESSGDSVVLDLPNGRVKLTSLNSVLWPATEGHTEITRRDYVQALLVLAPRLLPYLRFRPLAVRRSGAGARRRAFCQRHWTAPLPPFVQRISFAGSEGESDYLLCNNLETLLFLAENGALEFSVFTASLTESAQTSALLPLDKPDYVVFAVGTRHEPGEFARHDDDFQRVSEAALWLNEAIGARGLQAYVKTFRSTGLQVYMPLLEEYDYPSARQFADAIRQDVKSLHGASITSERSIERREGRVLIDISANAPARTVTAAYSPRAVRDAFVSTPLNWEDVGVIVPAAVTVQDAVAIVEGDDPWLAFHQARAGGE